VELPVLELGVISGATQAVARILRLSKTARLEAAVGRYTKLHGLLQGSDGLSESATKIALLIDFQVTNLVAREARALTQVYEWGGLIAAIVCTAIVVSPVYWLWTSHHWWSLLLAGILGLVGVLFLLAGITTIRKTPELDTAESAELTGTS
jgi:hypothetical protein